MAMARNERVPRSAMWQVAAFALLMLAHSVSGHGWGTDDMELFDLVEEINANFYSLMQINQTATSSEVKRAFRTLSVVMHPDKSDAEDANVQFRNLVSVYEVLKDPARRERYDKVLKEGLPNWKSALYYYRRVRKVGLAEGAGILLVIATVIQYAIAWAAYLERKYTAEQVLGSRVKKLQKKSKINVDLDALLDTIPRPSLWNLLPIQIPVGLYRLVVGTPRAIKAAINIYREQKRLEELRKQEEEEEKEEQRKLEEERAREKENRSLRKRNKKFVAPEKTDEELAAYNQNVKKAPNQTAEANNDKDKAKPLNGGLWTEDDLVELVRLVKKYPGGTADRWETIAETMNRAVSEVTYMAAKMKDTAYRVGQQNDSVAETVAQEAKQKVKTKKPDATEAGGSIWSQAQQQALEVAIQKYPKSASSDRWQKIANSVPGKTKEECLTRYKHLVELVKKLKEVPSEELPGADEAPTMRTPNATASGSDEPGQTSEDAEQKGKARNKRRERKKAIEYYSYDDSGEGSELGEI